MALTPNVVANAPILSAWGNEIRDRTIQHFPHSAAQAAGWPSPPLNSVSVTDDGPGILWVYDGTKWVEAAPRGTPINPVVFSAGMSPTTTTTVDITGATVTFLAVAGHTYRHTLHGHALSSVASDVIRVTLTDGANAVQSGATFDKVCALGNIADIVSFHWTEIPGATGNVTRKARVVRNSGTGNVQFFSDATRPGRWIVEEIGTP